MKKFFKILTFNLLILSLLMFIIEFFCTLILYKDFYKDFKFTPGENLNKFFNHYWAKAFNTDQYSENYFISGDFREPAGQRYLKNTSGGGGICETVNYKYPIVLIGDSFTYGKFLEDIEAFHSVLSAIAGRTVFNLGINGGSTREMLYILRNDDLRNKLLRNNNEIEYVIYTYIFDHKKRLFLNYRYKVPHFQIKKIENIKYLKYFIPVYDSYAYAYFRVYSKLLQKKLINLLYLYIDEIHAEVKKHFRYNGKPAKFVILVYEDDDTIDWEKVKEKGIIVINPHDILDLNIDDSYYRFPDSHPNENAWPNIVPALVKELNL